MHEASLHDRNCFLTLTYKDAPLSLDHRDVQKFLKRWRAMLPARSLRYYAGGEYGEENYRPHYHLVCFGQDFEDKYYWGTSPSGERLFRSPTLERLWPHGHSSIGAVTFESAAYVARYCMKKLTGDGEQVYYNIIDPDTGEIFPRRKEYSAMSKGIGWNWFRLYWQDCKNGKVVVRGHEATLPRFYMNKLKKLACYEDVAQARYEFAKQHHEDSSPQRLRAREEIVKARTSFLKRGKV